MAARERNTQFEEILDFLSSTPTPELIIAFRPSDKLQERVRFLLDKQQQDSLSADENAELDDFGRWNHLMSMLKIRARKKLAEA
jgi:hypothetical protein